VSRLEAEHKGPFHLIRDAKKWCRVPYTQQDRARLIQAGLEVH
jgi:hypothetical protein